MKTVRAVTPPSFARFPTGAVPVARPPKPSELHALQGTVAQASLAGVSSVPAGKPKVPKHLGPEGRKVFRDLVKQLLERRNLTRGDGSLIQLFAENYERRLLCAADLKTNGYEITVTRTNNHGEEYTTVKPNIHLAPLQAAERICHSILKDLGLTPVARERASKTESLQKKKFLEGSVGALLQAMDEESDGD